MPANIAVGLEMDHISLFLKAMSMAVNINIIDLQTCLTLSCAKSLYIKQYSLGQILDNI